jgi:hypothetical protein
MKLTDKIGVSGSFQADRYMHTAARQEIAVTHYSDHVPLFIDHRQGSEVLVQQQLDHLSEGTIRMHADDLAAHHLGNSYVWLSEVCDF